MHSRRHDPPHLDAALVAQSVPHGVVPEEAAAQPAVLRPLSVRPRVVRQFVQALLKQRLPLQSRLDIPIVPCNIEQRLLQVLLSTLIELLCPPISAWAAELRRGNDAGSYTIGACSEMRR
jgi:hypothetical protein